MGSSCLAAGCPSASLGMHSLSSAPFQYSNYSFVHLAGAAGASQQRAGNDGNGGRAAGPDWRQARRDLPGLAPRRRPPPRRCLLHHGVHQKGF